MSKLRVGILFGGRSGEHEVSLLSAASVLQAIDRSKYEILPLGITKAGRWLTGTPAERLLAPQSNGEAAASDRTAHPEPGTDLAVGGLLPSPEALHLDVLFPILHGTFGEDGTVQGLLEIAGIPYVGCGVLGAAAGMDKDVMKRLFLSVGLPIPRHIAVLRSSWQADPDAVLRSVEDALAYPLFVKPANGGSSVGVSKANTREELRLALMEAARYDRKLVIEEGVGGAAGKARELEVAILGNDHPEASVVGEIIPVDSRAFYDYEAKYLSDSSVSVIPASLTPAQSDAVRAMAIRAFQACDCSGLARVDFLLDPATETIYLNEINTLPGFTAISMYPKLWAASGLAYPALIDRLIALALERAADRAATSYTRE